jgi:hypothetical protein
VATTTGVTVFVVLLLLAVQVLFNLYATSAVTAAAFDGARLAAGHGGGDREAAEAHVHQVLGEYSRRPGFALTWIEDPAGDDVILRVRASNPGFLPRAVRAPLGFDVIDRTVRVRIEDAP